MRKSALTVQSNSPPMSVSVQAAGQSTSDYSATKAPENRPHVESAVPTDDPRARPGGAHGAPVSVGMESLYFENLTATQTDRQ